jgi:hypothetical protein
MRKEAIINKLRLPEKGLYLILLERINSCKCENGIRKFPPIFSKICGSFQLDKKKGWELLYFFQDLGFLKIIPCHGIKLLYSFEK